MQVRSPAIALAWSPTWKLSRSQSHRKAERVAKGKALLHHRQLILYSSVLMSLRRVPGPVDGHYGGASVRIKPTPVGAGITGQPMLKTMLQLVGVEDMQLDVKRGVNLHINLAREMNLALYKIYHF